MPAGSSPATSLADQLLDAQVRFHLDRLAGDQLSTTVAGLVEQVLDAVDDHRLEDLLDRETVKAAVVRAVAAVPASTAADHVVELLTTVAYDGPAEPFALGTLVPRERVEALLDEVLALTPVLERALDRLTESPLVGTAASRFMGRIVGEVLQANKAVTDKVPGLGSLMSFGTSAASKVMGAADKQFEGLIGDTMGKGGTFAVRRLNRIVLETLRDPTTREALLQVWDLAAREQVDGLGRYAEREQVSGVVDAVHDLAVAVAADERVTHLGEAVVDGLFDRLGQHTVAELLADLGLDRDQLVEDLAGIAVGTVEALRESGELERIVRSHLEPFYDSPQVRAILG